MADESTQSMGGGDSDRTRSSAPAAGVPRAFPATPIPARIGRYTIVRVLGEGGMGTVYEAEQDSPKRAVALKVIRAGYLSPQLLKRFEHESAVLGRLQHPGIAQVYEAGTVQDERGHSVPFFAMEFIRGVPLTEYANQKNLGTRERLDLVARICDAVYHAHQKGVIHRDLKPGNILVDDSCQPKILDFGVARATDSDIQQTTVQTDIGQLIGTVPYMSPEQVGGDPDELDTRSDVYALGVIAYELLAGRLPYDLTRKMIAEAARIIKEEEPTRLSSINRTLRGDVETIVAKALEKDKVRRYQSAESLASDIRRYLKDEPIAARPASTWYQLAKFSKRNRGLVAGVAAAFAVLVVGIVVSLIAFTQANYERDEKGKAEIQANVNAQRAVAEAEAASKARDAAEAARLRAEAINEFVVSSLQSSDPNQQGRQGMTVSDAMNQARAKLDRGDLKDQPATVAELLRTIAIILNGNGHSAAAEAPAARALAIERDLFPGPRVETALSLNNLAVVMHALGRSAESDSLNEQSLEMYRALYPGDHRSVARAMHNLALSRHSVGRFAEAQALYEQSLAMNRRLYAGDHSSVATSLTGLALFHQAMGRPAEGEPLLQQALEMWRRLFTGDDPAVVAGLNNLAYARAALGRHADAEPLYQQALDMQRRLFPGDHSTTAQIMRGIAAAHWSLGRPADAEPLYAEALAMFQRLFPGDHPDTAGALESIGDIRRALGRAAEAEAPNEQALTMFRRLYPGDHPTVGASLMHVAAVREALGRRPEAEPLFEESLAMFRRLYKDGHPAIVSGLNNLGHVRRLLGRVAEAEPLYAEAVDLSRRMFPGDHPELAASLSNVAFARQVLGRPAEADPAFEEALAMYQRLHPGDHPDVATGLHNLAGNRRSLGRMDDADALYTQALDMRRRILPRGHAYTLATLVRLAEFRASLARHAESVPVWREMADALAATAPAADWRLAYARSGLGGAIVGAACADATLGNADRLDQFREALPLLTEGYEGLAAAKETPRAPRDYVREACERAVRLFEAWEQIEPGKGYDAKAAEWKAKLDAIAPPPEPAKPTQSGRPDGG